MRTVTSPETGILWRLCDWDNACEIPATNRMDGDKVYCRWHRRCCTAPVMARDRDAFELWLAWLHEQYPAQGGWWGWSVEQLWPVVQGAQPIWPSQAA